MARIYGHIPVFTSRQVIIVNDVVTPRASLPTLDIHLYLLYHKLQICSSLLRFLKMFVWFFNKLIIILDIYLAKEILFWRIILGTVYLKWKHCGTKVILVIESSLTQSISDVDKMLEKRRFLVLQYFGIKKVL